MKKRNIVYVLLPALCLLVNIGSAQAPTGNPIVDAPTLAADIAACKTPVSAALTKADSTLVNFFTPYFPVGQAPSNVAALVNAVSDNVFLTNELSGLTSRTSPVVVRQAIAIGAVKAAANAGGAQAANLWSGTNLEDVLATFIANRFKQELEIAFLQKFKTWLDNNPTAKTLLPNTILVLEQSEPFNYTTFFEALKEALEKDVHALPADVGTYLGNNPFNLASNTSEYNNILVLYETAVQIAQGQNVFLALSAIDKNPLINAAAEPIGNAVLRIASVLTRTLINPASSPNLLSVTTIQNDLSTLDDQTLFIGLWMLANKSDLQRIMMNGQSLYAVLNGSVNRVTTFMQWFDDAVSAYQSMAATVQKINTLQNGFKGITGQLLGNIVASTQSVLLTIKGFPLVDADSFFPTATYQAIVNQLNDLSKVATDVVDSNYGMAVTDMVQYIKVDIAPHLDTPTQRRLAAILPYVQQYAGFAVSVAKAKTSQDLVDALDAAALPVGSYRIKRTSYKNISLNAWAGGFVGEQHYPGTVPISVKKDNLAYGFTVPVGIAYSWGAIATENHITFKKGQLNGVSNTIFLSILDIGALTAFRLTHDSTATLPDFKWQNVLAPGLFYVVGFRKSPLSLGAGVQYGPQLRSITNDAAVTLPSAITFRLFLGIDIPIFNFFTRTTEN